MREPLDELRELAGAGDPPRLPAAEIRRRGDRLRRRRATLQAVGAAAAVAVVATGGLLATGGVTGTSPAPPPATRPPAPGTPTPSPTASPSGDPANAAWTTSIPAPVERSVTGSLPQGAGTSVEDVDRPWTGLPCGGPGPADDPAARISATRFAGIDEQRTDQLAAWVSPPAEFHARQLVLYPDADTAAQAVAAIRTQAEECAPAPVDGIPAELRWSTRPLDLDAEEGMVLGGGTYAEGTDTPVPGRTLVVVLRQGNAVLTLLLSDESSAPVEDLTEPDAQALVDTADDLAAALCTFTEDGCPRG